MTDGQLLNQYVAGDKAAMETLVRRHIDLVYTAAVRARRCAPHDAEDVTQAVFFLLSQKAHRISPRDSLAGWLYQTTRRCAANLHKQNRRRIRLHQEAAMESHATASATAAEISEVQDFLAPALDRLKSSERDVILQRYLGQKSLEETAEALAISPEAARKRGERGLEKLRAYFAQRHVAAPSAALFAALHLPTPPALISTTLSAAAGAPAAHIATLAGKVPFFSATVKMLATAAVLIIAAAAIFLPRALASPISTPPTPSATPASTLAAAQPGSLPEITLAAQDPNHPTDAEVKTFLKARLARMNNLLVSSAIHTEYLMPSTGWPQFSPHLPDAEPPQGLIAGPALAIDALAPHQVTGAYLFLYPTGTSDSTLTLSLLDDAIRYDRKLLNYNPAMPLPSAVRLFHDQTYALQNNRLTRIFDNHFTSSSSTVTFRPSLPESFLEPILLLGSYERPVGRTAAPTITRRFLNPEDFDNFTITQIDPSHIKVSRQFGPGIRYAPAPTTSPASRPAANPPVMIPTEEWILDKSVGWAPTRYRFSALECYMAMSDFHLSAGLQIPTKITTCFFYPAPEPPFLLQPWRTDAITLTSFHVNDPQNTPDHYDLANPDAVTPPPDPRAVVLDSIELFIGAESVDQTALIHLNPAAMNKNYEPPPLTDPASSDAPAFRAAHERFLTRAADAAHPIDLLFFGDNYTAHWSDNPDLWKKFGDPTRIANFSLDNEDLPNLLWRATHGELDHLQPKTIILSAGSIEAANASEPGPAGIPKSFNPSLVSTSFSTIGGFSMTWPRPQYDVADITDALQTLIKTVHEKCPTSRILLLSIPAKAFHTSRAAAGFNPTVIRSDGSPARFGNAAPATLTLSKSIAQVNDALATVPDNSYTFIDLTPITLDDAGQLPTTTYQPNGLPTTDTYTKWTNQILPQLK